MMWIAEELKNVFGGLKGSLRTKPSNAVKPVERLLILQGFVPQISTG
jgi:hypothetical protein